MGRRRQRGRIGLYFMTFVWLVVLLPFAAVAAPYAGFVMDARNGEVHYSNNADTRLHPASLTKMMTLYIAFEAVQNGEISMDTVVTVSARAASEPPSALGLRAGQKIKLRYLVRAAAVKSANDAATAIAEAISGSEEAFARRMNRTAKAMGMTRTTFKNAHGLTQAGHLSTARDMTILGRHVLFDYQQYYNLFSRESTHAGVRTVRHTNRRFLRDYAGADGIKTGYTRAAGFNLTASAERGGERIIVTVFGGNSTATRNAKVAELMDLGFRKAPTRVAVRQPQRPPYMGAGDLVIARGADPDVGTHGRAVRTASAAVTRSLRPFARPLPAVPPAASDPLLVAALSAVQDAPQGRGDPGATAVADAAPDAEAQVVAGSTAAPTATPVAAMAIPDTPPVARPTALVAALVDAPEADPGAEIVTRLSTSNGRHWGINLGRYSSRFAAEKVLLSTALTETATLQGALRRVVQGAQGFDATFQGLDRDTAELACRRLQSRQITCFMQAPPGT